MKAYFQLLTKIQSGSFAPIYFLYGEESYYLDKLSQALDEHVLTEDQKAFNATTLYGKDIKSSNQVLDQLRRYPVMAPRQLVFLKEAQAMRQFSNLVDYFEKPIESTILVITYKHKKPDKRTKYYKALKKSGVVFESKKLYDNQVPAWIDQYLSEKNAGISPDALRMVAEYLGTDLQKISNELDKLLLRLGDKQRIEPGDVEESIGISREYNVFELQRALGKRDFVTAQKITENMRQNMKPHPMPLITASLYSYYQKIYLMKGARSSKKSDQVKLLGLRNDYFLREYEEAASKRSLAQIEHSISILRSYDLKSKGVNNAHVPEDELFREMVFKMLAV